MTWEPVAAFLAAVVLVAASTKATIYLWERARSRKNAIVAWWDERKRPGRARTAPACEGGEVTERVGSTSAAVVGWRFP